LLDQECLASCTSYCGNEDIRQESAAKFNTDPMHSIKWKGINVLLSHLCPKCSKKHHGTTSGSQTTGCTCWQWFFTPSTSNDSATVATANGGNTEVLTSQPEENDFVPSYKLDNAETSVSAVGHHRKPSMHHRLKIWISSGHNGIIGKYGSKLELGVPHAVRPLSDEHAKPGWPDWLINVAPEAVQGWFPRRADSFEKLDKVYCYLIEKQSSCHCVKKKC